MPLMSAQEGGGVKLASPTSLARVPKQSIQSMGARVPKQSIQGLGFGKHSKPQM